MVASEISQPGSTSAAAAATATRIEPATSRPCPAISNFSRLEAHEQAVRADQKHQRHHAINHEQFELRDEMYRGGTAYADDQCAYERTFDRAHAANRDH